MKIVAVINHKGGVGKTTFTGSTAQALALVGFRVLAIDNDSQHNLSTMLGVGAQSPSLRDVYRAEEAAAAAMLLKSVRATEVEGLHVITASSQLCDEDVPDDECLKRCLDKCNLERFYEVVLIDNAPGMDRLQAAAIMASSELFVPTELKQFAIDGIVEMDKVLACRFPLGGKISRIIPNFYRNTKRQNSFIAALSRLFPGKVVQTAIPVDPVFDEIITENKVLFLHRLASKGAAYYLKLIHELFDLEEDKVWDMVMEKRNDHKREEARRRFFDHAKTAAR